MSDPSKDVTAKLRAPKIEDFKGVLGWIEKKKKASEAEGKPWGWVMGLTAAVVVFFALAYAAYTAWRKSRQIAKLKHKVDVIEEKKEAAKADARLKKSIYEGSKLRLEAIHLSNRVEEIKYKIRKVEDEREKVRGKICKIKTWKDVDNLLNKKLP